MSVNLSLSTATSPPNFQVLVTLTIFLETSNISPIETHTIIRIPDFIFSIQHISVFMTYTALNFG